MKITVVHPFRLTLADGSKRKFEVGEHEVDKEVGEHWYVKAHLGKMKPEPKGQPAGTGGQGSQGDDGKDAGGKGSAKGGKDAGDTGGAAK